VTLYWKLKYFVLNIWIYLSIYLKSQDYGDVGAEAQQGRLTM